MKRALSFIFAFLMLFVDAGFAPKHIQADVEQPVRIKEVYDLRETNSDTYLLSDGSYECVVYAEDKYYKSERGELIIIDNSIIEAGFSYEGKEYAYSNADSDTVFHFSETQPSVLIESAKGMLAYSMIDADKTFVDIGGLPEYQKLFEMPLAGRNHITYRNVLPQTDITYMANKGALKEYIVIHGTDAPNKFTFSFDISGYEVAYSENGEILFVDKNQNSVFELCGLFAVDANGAYTEEVYYSVDECSSELLIVTIELSNEYLHSKERVFPIVIDPTVTITGASSTYDSFVASNYPASNYYMSTSLCTGKDSTFGIRRTYIKFNLPSSVPSGLVTGAYIDIKKNVGANPSISAYRVTENWSSSTVNWNNKPSNYQSSIAGPAILTSNNWYRLYLTNLTKKWLSGEYHNYGVLLRDATENNTSQWTSFYSSDAESPNKPELHIHYSAPELNYISVRIITDQSYVQEYGSGCTARINQFMSWISGAFASKWSIQFSNDYWENNTALPANYCSLQHNQCCHDHMQICGYDCHDNTDIPNHHKNHYRNWWTLFNENNNYADITVGFLGFSPCSAAGLSYDWLSTVCQPKGLYYWTDTDNVKILAHEISHLFGCPDHLPVSGQRCIMSGGYDNYSLEQFLQQTDIWCDDCEAVFNRLAH